MEEQTQPGFSEEDFAAPIDITPADRRGWNRQNQGFNLLCITTVVFLCGMSWIYDHYSELRYFKPGVALFDQHQYPAAERDFRSYLHLENDPDGHYFLGRTFLAEGKMTEARCEFLQDGIRTNGNGRLRPNGRSASYLQQLTK